MIPKQTVNRILIAGGGTAGWMAAASLSKHFRKTNIRIQLVESTEIGTVGVGEATIPTLRRFYGELGLDNLEVMAKTQATVKLGIEFRDWLYPGSSFIHPFGVFGQHAHDIPFHNYWLRLRKAGDKSPLAGYCLGAAMARAGKFAFPSQKPRSRISVFDWALHFDAVRFAALMRNYAESNGVERIDARIEQVETSPKNGFVDSLLLGDGRRLGADLFIDCTGFRGLLIEGALQTGYEDWSHWLPCDSAVSVQSERAGEPAPRTVASAEKAGWRWQIPLQQRQGNGHVYCSDFVSPAEAESTLGAHTDGELLQEPRHFRFTAGRRKLAWHKNCIALGLAAGFLEPLESTSIALVETAIERIRGSFRGPFFDQGIIDRFNSVTATEYDHVRDFIILHYKANGRDDSDFWQHCREMPVPDSLAEKMQAYRKRGELIHRKWEIFHPDSWLAIYDGFGIYPKEYDRRVDSFPEEYLRENLREMRAAIADSVASLPSHGEFLATARPPQR